MSSQQFNQVAYGLTQPLLAIFPAPIVANRAPLTSDFAQIGTLWINKSVNSVFVLTSIVSNAAVWELLSTSGAGGFFSSLLVAPGPTVLDGQFTVSSGAGNAVSIGNDSTDHSVTIGNLTGSSPLDLQGGSGGAILETAVTGPISIGGTGMTANIQIGNSVSGQAVTIEGAVNTGAQSVNIASGASAANSTVNILSGNATAGVQTFNVLTGTQAGIAHIADGGAANVVTIGSLTGIASLALRSGTAGTTLTTGVTGTISLGAATMTGAITVGQSTAGQPINIGAAANTGAQTISIGNAASGAGTNLITVGSTANASATTLNAGTAGITLTAPFVALPGPVYLYTGAGVPGNGLALHVGDIYINTTAASATTRIYVATAASTWTNVTCAA